MCAGVNVLFAKSPLSLRERVYCSNVHAQSYNGNMGIARNKRLVTLFPEVVNEVDALLNINNNQGHTLVR